MSAGRSGTLRLVVLVSGSGTNLQAMLDDAGAGRLDAAVVGVISDRPGVAALGRASRANVPAIVVEYAAAANREAFGAAIERAISALAPDLIALAGFMRILPAAVVNRFRGRMLNVHPSLLPAYPGLDTYRRALAAGERWHGSTVHFVTPDLDAGPAIIQYRVKIRSGETEHSLRERVRRGEYRIYPQAIQWFAEGRLELRNDRVWRDGAPQAVPVAIDEEPV